MMLMEKPKVHIVKRKNPSGRVCYTVRWLQDGKYHGRACGSDKESAMELRRQKIKALREGIDDVVRFVSWDDFVAEHLRKLRGSSRHTRNVQFTLTEFGEMFKPKGPQIATFRMVEDYHAALRGVNSARTINRKIRELHRAFRLAVKRRNMVRNPIDDEYPFEPEDELDPAQVCDDTKQRLLKACGDDAYWRAFLYLLMTTGCRVSEIHKLSWGRVDFGGEFFKLVKTKSRRVRLTPIVADAVAMLHELFDAEPKKVGDGGIETPVRDLVFHPLQWKQLYDGWTKLRNAVGMPGLQMKDFRPTAGSDAGDMEVSSVNVSDFLGHSDPRVTYKHYIRKGKLDANRRIAESLAARLKSA